MALRSPITVKSITDTNTSGTTFYTFMAPQDCDSLVFKVFTGGTFTGTNPTLDVFVQTTDDGGTSWFDCARIGQIVAAVGNASALWAVVPVAGSAGFRSGSVIGAAAPSSLSVATQSGLPLLSQLVRVGVKYGGTQVANTGAEVRVYANSQASKQ